MKYCDNCSKNSNDFSDMQGFRRHVKSHGGEVTCDHCGKNLKNERVAMKPLKTVHNKKALNCEQCNRSFPDSIQFIETKPTFTEDFLNRRVLNTKNILLTAKVNSLTPQKLITPPSTPPLTPSLTPKSNIQTTPKTQIQTPNSTLHTPKSSTFSSGKKRKASDNLSAKTVKRRGNYLMEQIEDLCDQEGGLKKFVLKRIYSQNKELAADVLSKEISDSASW